MTTADDGGSRFSCTRLMVRIARYLNALDQDAGEVDFAWQELAEIRKAGRGSLELERLAALESAVRLIDFP